MKKPIFSHNDMMMHPESRKIQYKLKGYSDLEIRMAEGEALRREEELIRRLEDRASYKEALANQPFAMYDPILAQIFCGMISSIAGRPATKDDRVISLPVNTTNKTYWVAKPASGVVFTDDPQIDLDSTFVELKVTRGWMENPPVEVEAGCVDNILGIVDLSGFIQRVEAKLIRNMFNE